MINVSSFLLPVTDVTSRTCVGLGAMTHVPYCSTELQAQLRAH